MPDLHGPRSDQQDVQVPKLLRRDASSLHRDIALTAAGELAARQRRQELRVEPCVVLQVVVHYGRSVLTEERRPEPSGRERTADIDG